MKLSILSALTLVFLGACQSLPSHPGKLPVVHGHRGSRGTLPENTMPAFEEANKAGADYIELDLHLTAEDVPLITHEPLITGALCRTSKGKPLTKPIPVKTTPLSKLTSLDCGSVPNPRFPEQKQIPGTKMPTFEKFLVWFTKNVPKHVQLNVETKMDAPSPELVPGAEVFTKTVVRLLRKYALVERTVLQSFDFRTLEVAKKIEPRLRLSALFEKQTDFCAETKKLGAQIASIDFTLMTKDTVEQCHQMGIELHPWTLNTESDWDKAIEWGVDGIITDYPRKLIEKIRPLQKTKG